MVAKGRRLALYGLVTLLGVALDQLAKAVVRSHLAPTDPIILASGAIRLMYSENVGAFLGLGAALPPLPRVLLFGVISGVLLVAVTAYVFTARDVTRLDLVGVSLLVAGGAGNLIDRILRDGRVTDFVTVGIGPLRTGVFNLADIFIMAGTGCVLWSQAVLHAGVGGPTGDPDRGPDTHKAAR